MALSQITTQRERDKFVEDSDGDTAVRVKIDPDQVKINEAMIIDDTSTVDIVYFGFAAIGTATSANTWKIYILEVASGARKKWADGDDLYNNTWDNITSLTYI